MYRYLSITIISLLSRSIFALECPEGQFLVSAHPRTSYYRTDGTFVNSSNVESYCRPYRFNKPLKLLFKNKIHENWPYQLEIFKEWSKSEKKEIKDVINNLPKSLRKLGEISIYRSVKSSFPNNPSTSGPDESIIVLYDGAKKYGYKKVLTHELAHILWAKLSSDDRDEYFLNAFWDKKMGKYKTSRENFSEADGKFNPEEDFANNIEHILTNKKYKESIPKSIEDCILKILQGNK